MVSLVAERCIAEPPTDMIKKGANRDFARIRGLITTERVYNVSGMNILEVDTNFKSYDPHMHNDVRIKRVQYLAESRLCIRDSV
jgi:hypothetical protein